LGNFGKHWNQMGEQGRHVTGSELWGSTAIVGVGESDYPAVYRGQALTKEEYALDAMRRALDDAGLAKDMIDGLVVSGMSSYESIMFRSGLENVRFLAHYPLGGRLCPQALAHAAMAVHHGMANYVVLFNTVGFRSAGVRFGGDLGASGKGAGGPAIVPRIDTMYDSAYGMASPGAQYALLCSRYLELSGEKEESLAAVARSTREWASMNPNAIFQEPITVDDYLASRYVARPLRLFDYCLVNDGCVAYIVTSKDRAGDLAHPPVLIGSVASRANVRPYYAAEDFWEDACRSLKADVLDRAGLGLDDIDILQVYDNFSPAVAWVLEGFGFCPRGEALQWMADGCTAPGGTLPVNTGGGMLSEAYLQGWNAHAETVRQLRGEAGARQVEGCRRVLYAALSAVPGASLLFRDDT
jgi:acetyl-CoA acetyltransferase